MNHSKNCSSNNNLQNIYNNNSYSDHLDNEYSKLHEYNNLARFNNCYFKGVRIRQFDFDGYSLQVVLFNSALFSLEFDEDKGLHYISPDELNKLSNVTEADFTIAMMHHSPDFLIDTQKQIIEKFICSKCNAFSIV